MLDTAEKKSAFSDLYEANPNAFDLQVFGYKKNFSAQAPSRTWSRPCGAMWRAREGWRRCPCRRRST
eukprot:15459401-Alexandrium_andersonii.AAC.1